MKNNIKTFTTLNVSRNAPEPTLWVFGCSHSFGVGLKSGEKNYGILIANELSMPLKMVAYPGSSLHFSLRHLVNADIQEGDVVIWQLTTAERFSYMKDSKILEVVLPAVPEPKYMDFFTDEQLYFHHLSLLNIGVMYLRAKKVKFILTAIPSTKEVQQEYLKYPEYCDTPNYEIDKGTDNLHSGPLSHQKLSQMLLKHIQSDYE